MRKSINILIMITVMCFFAPNVFAGPSNGKYSIKKSAGTFFVQRNGYTTATSDTLEGAKGLAESQAETMGDDISGGWTDDTDNDEVSDDDTGNDDTGNDDTGGGNTGGGASNSTMAGNDGGVTTSNNVVLTSKDLMILNMNEALSKQQEAYNILSKKITELENVKKVDVVRPATLKPHLKKRIRNKIFYKK